MKKQRCTVEKIIEPVSQANLRKRRSPLRGLTIHIVIERLCVENVVTDESGEKAHLKAER
jgi:predicted transcriptional regulator